MEHLYDYATLARPSRKQTGFHFFDVNKLISKVVD